MKFFSPNDSLILTTLLIWPFLIGLFGCERKPQGKDAIIRSAQESQAVAHPEISSEEAYERAKAFVRIYLEDPETYFRGVKAVWENEISAEFGLGRWYVFFSNGILDINVQLDKSGELGTIRGSPVITEEPDPNAAKYGETPPLFTLSEFERVLKLPHNDKKQRVLH